jgi:transposase
MRDVELVRQLLGLKAPWFVRKVEIAARNRCVDVWLGHRRGYLWPCPECGVLYKLRDHKKERAWRHLDTWQLPTYLHASVPRIRCEEHGTLCVELPWADVSCRYTYEFECYAIDVLTESNVDGASRILRMSWRSAWHIMERAVQRGLASKSRAPPRRIGIDEKAIAKGHKYMTIVCDLDGGTVEYVAEDRCESSLDEYYLLLSDGELAEIEAIAMDMWDAFIASTLKYVPGARDKIVFDRYHIMGYIEKAVDKVRCQEHRLLMEEGDESLKGTKYYWLYNEKNLPGRYKAEFRELKNSKLKTARAWAIKESLLPFWDYKTEVGALRHWKRWYFWATHSRLKPVVEAARTMKRHLPNILTYFCHRITNAMAEGLNSQIQRIKHDACGYRNKEHFKIAIYFYCGGLDLHPLADWKYSRARIEKEIVLEAEVRQLHLW